MSQSPNRFYNFYEKLAKNYDIAYGRLLAHGQKMGIKAMKLKSDMKILEVGVGTGLTFPHYPKAAHIVGVDISQAMLNQAQEKVKQLKLKDVELVVMSAEKLEFKDNTFDRVFAPSVISVVNYPEKVISEMIRVCKPGGHICIVAHFAGENVLHRTIDKLTNPVTTRFLGFRTTTPRQVIESLPATKSLLKKNTLPMNFSTLYLLEKK